MNSILAQIYGTGFDKTASAADDGYIDLNNISGADLMAGLEDGSIVLPDGGFEKEAGDLDLSELTGTELLQLMNELEDGSGALEKMASSGDLEYFDMAGRVMAHAYADEMRKVAGADDYIDLDSIDGHTLLELLDSGEYEIIEAGHDKHAASRSAREFGTYKKGGLGANSTPAQRAAARKAENSAISNAADTIKARKQRATPKGRLAAMGGGSSSRAALNARQPGLTMGDKATSLTNRGKYALGQFAKRNPRLAKAAPYAAAAGGAAALTAGGYALGRKED